MYLVPIAWMYVVSMMALVEAMSARGTLLGALFTFVLYGVLPLSIVMYLMGTPHRRRARRRAEAAQDDSSEPGPDPDGRGHAAGGSAVAPVRKEP